MSLSFRKLMNLVDASGLMPRAEIQALVRELPKASQPKDGEQLAQLLVERQKLTGYQSRQLMAGNGKSLLQGNYVILDELGQGGMGTVFRARHRSMERVVALKILVPELSQRPNALARFQREMKATSRLEHPNLIVVHDAGESDGTYYLVMEYIEGTDLKTLVDQTGPLPEDRAIFCIAEAARGLEYAHAQGVIHRDVNPSNILLDSSGTTKILDMGIARVQSAEEDQAQLTAIGQILGTLDYMSPEQAVDARKADTRADIYSLGITLWYVLTGQVPYPGDTMMGRLVAHRTSPIPSLQDACPELSSEVDQVFRRMVAKTPEDRYQTMTDVIVDLERILKDPPAGAAATSEPSRK